MIDHEKRKELEAIISGESITWRKDNLTSARNFLSERFSTSTKIERKLSDKSDSKEEQKSSLIAFCNQHDFWFKGDLSDSNFLTEGGEAKVYFDKKKNTVVKANDAIYYSTWLDYLNALLLHNLFFSDTAYSVAGFSLINDELYAIAGQPFIIADAITNLDDVKTFLGHNGFKNTKRNDYYNSDLGLILEDMHDENVLTSNNTLFFIDTVFYIDIRA